MNGWEGKKSYMLRCRNLATRSNIHLELEGMQIMSPNFLLKGHSTLEEQRRTEIGKIKLSFYLSHCRHSQKSSNSSKTRYKINSRYVILWTQRVRIELTSKPRAELWRKSDAYSALCKQWANIPLLCGIWENYWQLSDFLRSANTQVFF